MTDKTIRSIQMISVRWWNANAYYAVSLAEALQNAGRMAAVCGRSNSPALRKAIEKNLDRIDTVNFVSGNPFRLISSLSKLIKQIRKRKISILAAHRSQDVLFAFFAKRRTKNTVKLVRCVSDVRPPKDHVLNRYIHETGIDYLIFSCHALRQRYIDIWPFIAEKSRVIYSAVDTEHFTTDHPSSFRKKLNIPENSVVVSMIARLSPVKDHQTFISAAARVLEENPDCIFLISGEDFEISMEELRNTCRKLNIEKKFRFMRKATDVRDLISVSDIGVVCSKGSEVVCRIALEFMAMGKPLVVSDINILPEIIEEGENGFVFPVGNSEFLAEKLGMLMSNEKIRRLFGNRARRICEENFSYPVLVRESEAVYEDVLITQKSEV